MAGFALFLLVTVSEAAAQGPPAESQPASEALEPTDCLACHAETPGLRGRGPLGEVLRGSVHADLDCTDCHSSIDPDDIDPSAPRPHGADVPTMENSRCGECHTEALEVYRQHGRLKIGTDPDIPNCWDCHGSHDILPGSDLRSHVHPANLPSTCRSCHADVDMVEKHDILRTGPIQLYEASVHGQASKKGLYVHATCNDCHSAMDPDGQRTAHRILDPANTESTINHFNIPDTCSQCHAPIAKDYWDGIHGQLVKRGDVASPVCTHCHGEHGITSPDDPRSPVSPARVAEATCSPCHESEILNEKYGIPAGRLRSYVDSYHGLKSKAGDVHVANCASCHGAHRILPHTDPKSSINPANLQHTCGECHPGITAEMASEPIHETATGIRTGWPEFIRILYLWMIGIVIGLMILHSVADYVRHVKILRRQPFVVRLTPNETAQHWVLTISFVVLVLSGFALRFSEAFWVQWLFGWGGGRGFEMRGTVHRIAAVVFAICCVWHLLYLFTGRGRHAMRDMILSWRDIINIKDNALFFLGLRSERPRFGRFTYMEKSEYWALVWGAVIMGATGLLLWFDNYFVEKLKLPKGVLDCALVIHYYEAWLATLAIFVWHGYSTIFSPHVYPMNPAWLGGTMPQDMYSHEHPDAPKLKVRVKRVLDAEEVESDAPSRHD